MQTIDWNVYRRVGCISPPCSFCSWASRVPFLWALVIMFATEITCGLQLGLEFSRSRYSVGVEWWEIVELVVN